MTPEQQKALAIARARRRRAEAQGGAPKPPQSGLAEQFGSGANEGLAGFAGLPVDLATSLINGMVQRPQFDAQMTVGPDGRPSVSMSDAGVSPGISSPFGGAETMTQAMSPFISDVAPQGMAQRYARRAGQELGFGVPAAIAMAGAPGLGTAARGNMPVYAATSAAGDIGSAVSGQTSQEIAPGNSTADLIASMIGGGGVSLAASRMTPEFGPVPTREQIGMQANSAWDAVKAAPERLTDQATDNLRAAVRSSLPTSQLAPDLYPNAFGAAQKMDVLQNPSIYDVSELRRIIGDTVAGDPKEARAGMAMKEAIENYLAGLKPADVSGANPSGVVDDLSRGLDLSARGYRADAVLNKEMRGETRAATSGSGGNQVNATRQNIRALFDKARDPTLRGKSGGFKPEELAQMERAVMGTPAQNAARNIGRLAPTSNALSMMTTGIGGASGATAALMGGSPLMAVPAIAGGIGMGAKAIAESMAENETKKLIGIILNGGKLPESASRNAATAALIQQMLSTAAAGNQQ